MLAGLFVSSPLTSFGSETLFTATDASGNTGEYISDGTTPGTLELANLAPSSGGTTAARGFTETLGSVAVFDQTDATGNDALWATDGTVGGTHEILSEANNSGGVLPTPANDNYPAAAVMRRRLA